MTDYNMIDELKRWNIT